MEGVISLKQPEPSASVKNLQNNLKRWGFDPGAVTGILDEQTVGAINALQRKLGVMVTGEYNEATKRAVEEDLASPNSLLKKQMGITDEPTSIIPFKQPVTTEQPQTSPTRSLLSSPIFWIVAGGAALYMFGGRGVNIDGVDYETGEDPDPLQELEKTLNDAPRKKRKPHRRTKRAKHAKVANSAAKAKDAVIDV